VKDDQAYLAHIRDSIARIDSRLFNEPMVQDAVIRNLEIIGEAVKQLSIDLRTAHPQLPWKQIAGMRDVLIHHYFGVKLEAVWQVVVADLPVLRELVERLLDQDTSEA